MNLPTKEQWNNVSLLNSRRQILTHASTTTNTGGNLLVFEYTNRAARLLTFQEAKIACNYNLGGSVIGELDGCIFLQENTTFSDMNLGHAAYWMENPISWDDDWTWVVNAGARFINNVVVTTPMGIRPVIDMAKSDMEI